MSNPDIAALDQAGAALGDTLPPMWRRIYKSCLTAGFTERESFSILQVYILSLNPGGINLPKDV